MRAPEFWSRDCGAARLLAPLSELYAWAARRKMMDAKPVRAGVPVICVGNIVAGGAGKTPVCLALAERLRLRGRNPHFLTRGYGGREKGPLAVDASRHDDQAVGDEALLLAGCAPTWVARHRPDGAAAAALNGADVIVMDDGFQNFTLHKDLSVVVIDGGYGFGNGRVMPAGPCRENVEMGLARAQAVVLIGEDRTGAAGHCTHQPVLRARLTPGPEAGELAGRKVLAFAGIGRPQKFFDTLHECGADMVSRRSFPDHHPFDRSEVLNLLEQADALGAIPVTTAKDHVRLPADLRRSVKVLTVSLVWEDPALLDSVLDAVS